MEHITATVLLFGFLGVVVAKSLHFHILSTLEHGMACPGKTTPPLSVLEVATIIKIKSQSVLGHELLPGAVGSLVRNGV